MENTPFQKVMFKASHNSYDRDETIYEQLEFHKNDPSNSGCRGLELDIWRKTQPYTPYEQIPAGYFIVSHIISSGDTLSSYLSEILLWHKNNPNHGVVTVFIDIKSSDGGYDSFNVAFDTYLKCYFDESLIFKPGKLLVSEGDLCENVVKNGWPSLDEEKLKGKFIFCLTGNADWKKKYADGNMNENYCFCDEKRDDDDKDLTPPTKGNIVFFNFHVYSRHASDFKQSVPRFSKKNLITRAYEVDGEDLWDDCMDATFSMLATNKVSGHDWCYVNKNSPYKTKSIQLD